MHQVVAWASPSENAPPKWTPAHLYPDKDEYETAEKLADFLNGISQEYAPLRSEEILTTFQRDLPTLTCSEVAKRLKKGKNSSSKVKDDINP